MGAWVYNALAAPLAAAGVQVGHGPYGIKLYLQLRCPAQTSA